MATAPADPRPLPWSTIPAREPSASVVICAYTEERWDDLVAAVRSAQRQTVAPLEVIVVVDHNPALLERARAGLGVVVVPNTAGRGLSGARNSGVGVARGDVVAFLDDDAVADPEWLERLLEPYSDPRVLGVGGTVDPRWLSGRPRWFPSEFQWVVGCSYAGLRSTAGPVRNVIGANMSLRRELFSAIGGFQSGIGRIGRVPVGCEETELCIRAHRLAPGGLFLHQPAARVAHAVPAARTSWRYFFARCFAEGRSKALVSSVAGSRDALSAERRYAARALPAGVVRGIFDALRGDAAGLARAAAIVGGLAVTTAGYVKGLRSEP